MVEEQTEVLEVHSDDPKDYKYREYAFQDSYVDYSTGEIVEFFTRNHFAEDSNETLKSFRYKGIRPNTDLYATAFLYDKFIVHTEGKNKGKPNGPAIKEASSYYAPYFFLDFDHDTEISLAIADVKYAIWFMKQKTMFALNDDAFRIYFSGSKGFHVMVDSRYLGIKPNKLLPKIFKEIAKDIEFAIPYKTLDLVIYEARRLFRVPYSINSKSGCFKIELTVSDLNTLSAEQIQEKARSTEQKILPETLAPTVHAQAHNCYLRYAEKATKVQKQFEDRQAQWANYEADGNLPRSVREEFEMGLSAASMHHAGRNDTVHYIAWGYKKAGKPIDEAINDILPWASTEIGNDFTEREVLAAIDSTYKVN
jgi:hypothetical protein